MEMKIWHGIVMMKKALGKITAIASLNFGVERKFSFKHK
jgi:hypothetical protein